MRQLLIPRKISPGPSYPTDSYSSTDVGRQHMCPIVAHQYRIFDCLYRSCLSSNGCPIDLVFHTHSFAPAQEIVRETPTVRTIQAGKMGGTHQHRRVVFSLVHHSLDPISSGSTGDGREHELRRPDLHWRYLFGSFGLVHDRAQAFQGAGGGGCCCG